MENTRYDYSPLIQRKPFKLPNEARLALWGRDQHRVFRHSLTNFGGAGAMASAPPNVFDYAPRTTEQDRHLEAHGGPRQVRHQGGRCSSTLRSARITRSSSKRERNGAGNFSATARPTQSFSPDGRGRGEKRSSRPPSTSLRRSVGQRPRGWLGPALQESFDTRTFSQNTE